MTVPCVVLVAEDDVLVRNLVHAALLRAGYPVLMAADGEEALELSRRYSGEINLLLSDGPMPRMDGFQLAKRIRLKKRPRTTHFRTPQFRDCEGNESFDFLRKPFFPDQSKLRKFSHGRQ